MIKDQGSLGAVKLRRTMLPSPDNTAAAVIGSPHLFLETAKELAILVLLLTPVSSAVLVQVTSTHGRRGLTKGYS